MNKNTNFIGQPIFGQILSIIKRGQIHTIARKHGSDRYFKKFTTYKHLVTMLYLVFEGCTSIREVTTGLLACSTKLFQLRVSYYFVVAPDDKKQWMEVHKDLTSNQVQHFWVYLFYSCYQNQANQAKFHSCSLTWDSY